MQDGVPREISIEMVLLGGKQRTVAEIRARLREESWVSMSWPAGRPSQAGTFVVECRPSLELRPMSCWSQNSFGELRLVFLGHFFFLRCRLLHIEGRHKSRTRQTSSLYFL